MVLIDSNVFIAAFRSEEENHSDAIDILENTKEIALLDYVLAEVGTVLLLKEGNKIMKNVFEFLTKANYINIVRLNDNEISQCIQKFKEQKGKLAFVDVALLVLSKVRKLKLITFDKELKKTCP